MLGATPQQRGYTLVELLVVLGILGVLSAMALPVSEVAVQRAKEQELRRALWEIRDAIDAYHAAATAGAFGPAGDVPRYPASLAELAVAVPDSRPQRQGQLMRFLRRVPRDPFAPADLPAEQTWGLRSYLSEHAAPEPGRDVYDVHSRSNRMGLNGVALRQW